MIQTDDSDTYVNQDENYKPWLICVITSYHHEYSAGGTRRGKSHDITFENIHLYGKYEPSMYFEGYDEEHKTKDITIKNVYHNDKPVTEFSSENFVKKDFTENIIYKTEK